LLSVVQRVRNALLRFARAFKRRFEAGGRGGGERNGTGETWESISLRATPADVEELSAGIGIALTVEDSLPPSKDEAEEMAAARACGIDPMSWGRNPATGTDVVRARKRAVIVATARLADARKQRALALAGAPNDTERRSLQQQWEHPCESLRKALRNAKTKHSTALKRRRQTYLRIRHQQWGEITTKDPAKVHEITCNTAPGYGAPKAPTTPAAIMTATGLARGKPAAVAMGEAFAAVTATPPPPLSPEAHQRHEAAAKWHAMVERIRAAGAMRGTLHPTGNASTVDRTTRVTLLRAAAQRLVHTPAEADLRDIVSETRALSTHLDAAITPAEVGAAVARLKLRKSGGEDGVSSTAMRAIFTTTAGPKTPPLVTKRMEAKTQELLTVLAGLFTMMINTSHVPSNLRSSRCIALWKRKGDSSDPNKYRGITISSMTMKLLQYVVFSRIQPLLEAGIPREQSAFQHGRRTQEGPMVVALAMAAAHRRGETLYVIQLDAVKAFDKCNRDMLLSKMAENGVTGPLLRFVEAEFDQVRRIVHFDGSTSEPIADHLGIQQGAILSPTLYAAAMSGIATRLNAHADEVATTPGQARAGVHIAPAHRESSSSPGRIVSTLFADDMTPVTTERDSVQGILTASYAESIAGCFELRADETCVTAFPPPGSSPAPLPAWTLGGLPVITQIVSDEAAPVAHTPAVRGRRVNPAAAPGSGSTEGGTRSGRDGASGMERSGATERAARVPGGQAATDGVPPQDGAPSCTLADTHDSSPPSAGASERYTSSATPLYDDDDRAGSAYPAAVETKTTDDDDARAGVACSAAVATKTTKSLNVLGVRFGPPDLVAHPSTGKRGYAHWPLQAARNAASRAAVRKELSVEQLAATGDFTGAAQMQHWSTATKSPLMYPRLLFAGIFWDEEWHAYKRNAYRIAGVTATDEILTTHVFEEVGAPLPGCDHLCELASLLDAVREMPEDSPMRQAIVADMLATSDIPLSDRVHERPRAIAAQFPLLAGSATMTGAWLHCLHAIGLGEYAGGLGVGERRPWVKPPVREGERPTSGPTLVRAAFRALHAKSCAQRTSTLATRGREDIYRTVRSGDDAGQAHLWIRRLRSQFIRQQYHRARMGATRFHDWYAAHPREGRPEERRCPHCPCPGPGEPPTLLTARHVLTECAHTSRLRTRLRHGMLSIVEAERSQAADRTDGNRMHQLIVNGIARDGTLLAYGPHSLTSTREAWLVFLLGGDAPHPAPCSLRSNPAMGTLGKRIALRFRELIPAVVATATYEVDATAPGVQEAAPPPEVSMELCVALYITRHSWVGKAPHRALNVFPVYDGKYIDSPVIRECGLGFAESFPDVMREYIDARSPSTRRRLRAYLKWPLADAVEA
jgi:hypothetical protein